MVFGFFSHYLCTLIFFFGFISFKFQRQIFVILCFCFILVLVEQISSSLNVSFVICQNEEGSSLRTIYHACRSGRRELMNSICPMVEHGRVEEPCMVMARSWSFVAIHYCVSYGDHLFGVAVGIPPSPL